MPHCRYWQMIGLVDRLPFDNSGERDLAVACGRAPPAFRQPNPASGYRPIRVMVANASDLPVGCTP